jgi:hypothetical protein
MRAHPASFGPTAPFKKYQLSSSRWNEHLLNTVFFFSSCSPAGTTCAERRPGTQTTDTSAVQLLTHLNFGFEALARYRYCGRRVPCRPPSRKPGPQSGRRKASSSASASAPVFALSLAVASIADSHAEVTQRPRPGRCASVDLPRCGPGGPASRPRCGRASPRCPCRGHRYPWLRRRPCSGMRRTWCTAAPLLGAPTAPAHAATRMRRTCAHAGHGPPVR